MFSAALAKRVVGESRSKLSSPIHEVSSSPPLSRTCWSASSTERTIG